MHPTQRFSPDIGLGDFLGSVGHSIWLSKIHLDLSLDRRYSRKALICFQLLYLAQIVSQQDLPALSLLFFPGSLVYRR